MIFKNTLRAKLFYLTISLLVVFSISLSIYLKTHFADIMSKELLKRGASIARLVAEDSASAFIEHDFLKLESLAKDQKKADADIVYILMLNQNNDVVAHSFQDGYPLGLNSIRHSLNRGETSISSIDFGGTPLYDIAAPVMDARIGSVRIGLSAQPLHQSVDTMIRQIIGTVLALGLLSLIITLPVLQAILKPIATLTNAVEGLAGGNRETQLPVSSNDEVGLLTEAFNHMLGTINSAEKGLAAQVEFLQVLIDDIPLPVFYKNRQGVMLGCNHAYTEIWGKSKQEIIGHHTNDIYSRADAELHLRKDKELLELQTPISYEQKIVDAKGLTRHIVYKNAFFSDETGAPAGTIGVMQDVTGQRRTDQMKSDFVSTVAHEFQTPLATILGFVELIQEGILNPVEHRGALDLITQKGQALSEMVDELLDLAQLDAGKGLKVDLEPCNVNDVVAALVNNFKKRKTSHHFELEHSAEDIVVFADKIRMEQVMENLLSNAVKYSKKQSTVKIVTTTSDTYCQIKVSDQGIGMTENQAKQAFEKYYRADTSNTAPSGTGLGLFITKSIIDAHNGHIEVDSIFGKRTSVTVRLPIQRV